MPQKEEENDAGKVRFSHSKAKCRREKEVGESEAERRRKER